MLKALNLTCEQLNRTNRRYWATRTRIVSRKMKNPEINRRAYELISRIDAEQCWDRAVFQAEEELKRERIALASPTSAARIKGGMAERTDFLQEQIEKALERYPRITAGELLRKLKKNVDLEIAKNPDSKQRGCVIHFQQLNGLPAQVRSCVLKDRLSTARGKRLAKVMLAVTE